MLSLLFPDVFYTDCSAIIRARDSSGFRGIESKAGVRVVERVVETDVTSIEVDAATYVTGAGSLVARLRGVIGEGQLG